MKKYLIPAGIILLILIAATWMDARRKTTKELPEELEKCLCGQCDLDIFSCKCPTAKEQRKKYGR